MTLMQIILLISAVAIFVIFFKQLFSGNYPRRGIDYEAKTPNDRIGEINRPNKTFSKAKPDMSRVEQLLSIADKAISEGDNLEAKKALQTALIVDGKNIEVLKKLGDVYMRMNDYSDAKGVYQQSLEINPNSTDIQIALAEAHSKLGEKEEALAIYRDILSREPDRDDIKEKIAQIES